MNRVNPLQIVMLILVLLVVVFFLQNVISWNAVSNINFLFMRGYVRTGWLILSCLLLGGVVGYVMALLNRRR